MLLLAGGPESVASWARRGLVPVHLVPLGQWTAALAAGPSQATAPYDDALRNLAGRPVAPGLRPAVGLFAVDAFAMISTHRRGWRATQRWCVWSAGEGALPPSQLAAGKPSDLVAAAGLRDPTARAAVRDILRDGRGDALGVLLEVLAVLGLPGSELLGGRQDPAAAPGSSMVVPDQQHVERFERIVNDEVRHRAELEES